jgi:hypothetical protein
MIAAERGAGQSAPLLPVSQLIAVIRRGEGGAINMGLAVKATGCKKRANGGNAVPKMTDSRRKRIQAKQRKATNALHRAAKLAKRKRNNAKAGAPVG